MYTLLTNMNIAVYKAKESNKTTITKAQINKLLKVLVTTTHLLIKL